MALVRYWKLREESSGVTPSVMGDGFGGTLGPTYPSDSASVGSGPCSSMATAIDFDGANDLITFSGSPHTIGNVLSIAVWVYPRDLNRRTFYSAAYALNYPMFGISTYVGGGSLEVVIPGVYLAACQGSVVVANKWQHICIVRSGSAAADTKFYVDGVQYANLLTATATLDSAAGTAVIGCRSAGLQHWNGKLTELRIYDVALDQASVMSLFNEGRRDNSFLAGQP